MKQYKRLVEKSVNKRIRTIIQQDRNVGNCAENSIKEHGSQEKSKLKNYKGKENSIDENSYIDRYKPLCSEEKGGGPRLKCYINELTKNTREGTGCWEKI